MSAGAGQQRGDHAGASREIVPSGLPPGEWVLTAGGPASPQWAAGLMARYPPRRGGGFAVVRVPRTGEADWPSGPVLLYHGALSTTVYCPAAEVTPLAAVGLQQRLASQFRATGQRVWVERLPHRRWATCMRLHPVFVRRVDHGAVTAWVCERQITTGLAAALQAVLTAHGLNLADHSSAAGPGTAALAGPGSRRAAGTAPHYPAAPRSPRPPGGGSAMTNGAAGPAVD